MSNPSGELIENLDSTIRKEGGIYYTPLKVTQFIVKNTIFPYFNFKIKNIIEQPIPELNTIKYEEISALLRQCDEQQLKLIENRLKSFHIADICCGSGNFVLSIYNSLFELYRILTDKNKKKIDRWIFLNNLFLVDLYPKSVEIAKLSIWSKIASKNIPLNDLDNNIKVGNSLIAVPNDIFISKVNSLLPPNAHQISEYKTFVDPTGKFTEALYAKYIDDIHPFVWQNEFPEVFNNNQKFDIIVGNPPYIGIQRQQKANPILAHYYFDTYSMMVEQADIYIAFIQNCLENLLNKGGYLGYIVSNKFLTLNYGKPLVKELIKNYSIEILVDLEGFRIFKGVNVDTLIMIVRNIAPDINHKVKVMRPKKLNFNFLSDSDFKINYFPQKNFIQTDEEGNQRYLVRLSSALNSEIYELLREIEKNSFPLHQIVYIREGIKINSKTFKDATKRRPKSYFTHDSNPEGKYKKLIDKTEHIGDYHLIPTHQFLDYQPQIHMDPVFPELFENEKIVVVNVSGYSIKAIIDKEQHYVSHNCTIFIKKDLLPREIFSSLSGKKIASFTNKEQEFAKKFSQKFLFALIKSDIMHKYFKHNLGDGLHVYPTDIASFRVPNIDFDNPTAIEKVQRIEQYITDLIELDKRKVEKEHIISFAPYYSSHFPPIDPSNRSSIISLRAFLDSINAEIRVAPYTTRFRVERKRINVSHENDQIILAISTSNEKAKSTRDIEDLENEPVVWITITEDNLRLFTHKMIEQVTNVFNFQTKVGCLEEILLDSIIFHIISKDKNQRILEITSKMDKYKAQFDDYTQIINEITAKQEEIDLIFLDLFKIGRQNY